VIESRSVVIGYCFIITAIIIIHQFSLLYWEIHFDQQPKDPTYMICRSIHDYNLSPVKQAVEADMLEAY